MSLFIDANISDDVIKQQIATLIAAGYETSALTISYSILMLAMHPKIQEQVFDELHEIYDIQNEETTYEHLSKFDLLDRVIKETMRLFPAAPVIGRTSTIDFPLSDCIIPKGTTITIPIVTLHRVKFIVLP